MAVSWKGYVRISLVSIPVRAYTAVDSDADEIHFNQLHKTCNSRIRYKKTCPIHGEVSPSEIVLGYEYDKNKYVVVEKEELESLQSSEEKMINIEAIVPVTEVDPLYFTERSAYLVPDGSAGQKPFAVIQKAFLDGNVAAIGRTVRNGKDSIVMIRARKNLLTMTTLNSAAQVRSIDAFATEVSPATISAAELKLTKSLFEAYSRDTFDLTEFPEHYTGKVRELVDAKLRGHEIVQPIASEEPHVINLMDALRKSVESAKSSPKKSPKDKPAKPPRKHSRTG